MDPDLLPTGKKSKAVRRAGVCACVYVVTYVFAAVRVRVRPSSL